MNIDTNIKAIGRYIVELRHYLTGALEHRLVVDNLITDDGLEALLAGLNDFSHIALGDGDTAVTPADTALDNETFRIAVQTSNQVGNKRVFGAYLDHSQGNGDIEEIGIFRNGSSVADTGDLFSRVTSAGNNDLPKTKTNLQTLSINYELTLING